MAQPMRPSCARACSSVRSLRNPGIASSLSSVPPVCPSPRPDDHRHRDAHSGHERREHQRHLIAHAARRVFVDARRRDAPQIERAAAPQHRLRERGGLVTIEAAQIRGHEKRRHLVVGYVPREHTRRRARATRPARCVHHRVCARSIAGRACANVTPPAAARLRRRCIQCRAIEASFNGALHLGNASFHPRQRGTRAKITSIDRVVGYL